MIIKNELVKKIIFSIMLVGLVFCFTSKAESWSIYDTQEMRFSRHLQGLSGESWSDWHVNYNNKIQETHNASYKYTQRIGKGGYFKSGEIEYRPLIIWFAYKNGTVSEPQLVYSSGSKKYDNFNIQIVKNTKVPAFPSIVNKVFMWDGDVTDLVKYLKYRGVFPPEFSISSNINSYHIRWDKL